MQRSLADLGHRRFDVAIVGGGITGCCIARDAARRGLSVALVEQHDFSSGTSAATSKMVHGGLRYLRQLEFGVVRESLRERRVWQHIAPQTVRGIRFLLPATNRRERWTMRAGLALYDALSLDRNRGLPVAQHMAASRALSRKDIVAREPVLDGAARVGGCEYADAHSASPERLAIACLLDATDHGAIVANYVALDHVDRGPDFVLSATDRVSGATVEVRARSLINATGPWADLIAPRLGLSSGPALVRSKGIHLVTRPLTGCHALTIPVEGRHFFVIPWGGCSLIGTTDTPFDGTPDGLTVSAEEIASFLATINRGLPAAHLNASGVRFAYAGLRPLLASPGAGTYAASRKSGITHDGRGCFTVIGGKWTTARAVAERCVDALVRHLGVTSQPCDTAVAVLPDDAPELVEDGGAVAPRFRAAIANEMALTLADLIFRRTNLGARAVASPEQLVRWAALAAPNLAWSDAEVQRQVREAIAVYQRASVWIGEA